MDALHVAKALLDALVFVGGRERRRQIGEILGAGPDCDVFVQTHVPSAGRVHEAGLVVGVLNDLHS